jgi:hypothetical protein
VVGVKKKDPKVQVELVEGGIEMEIVSGRLMRRGAIEEAQGRNMNRGGKGMEGMTKLFFEI